MKNRALSWLTDRLILQPTTHPIHVAGKRLVLDFGTGQLEVWIQRRGTRAATQPNLYLLEFVGTASRAEESSEFLEGCWSDADIEIWSVNPPGYGGSSGRASLREFSAMACRAFDELQRVAGRHPVVVAGSSLGCVSALYLTAHRAPNGLLLQNPPDLREVILSIARWWPLSWVANVIAQQVPDDLDSIRNAAESTAPAVFVLALQDRIVPTRTQQQVFAAYAGPKRVIELPDADHDTPFTESESHQLQELKVWLHKAVAN